jgi:serine protease Do
MKTTFAVVLSLAVFLHGPARADGPGTLRQLSNALTQLADKVSPAVVQIVVSGYGPVPVDERQTDAAFVTRQHGIGSGVIVDPAGYIVTNAHVVQGAQRLQVLLATTSSAQARRQAMKKGVFKARLVGVHPEADLAVLKIDAEGLPAIPLRDLAPVKQGELVVALGSPQGLASSMTMGVVSAPAREPELDVPMLFVQTDTPINPGNSGGPLINADGDVVGINTFILSRSGGSQGLGFAIPVNVVRFVYEGLRKNGRVDRVELGLSVQGISPTLSDGLGLQRDWGVVISDVAPGGPAETAGLRRADIIDVVDGRPIDSAASLLSALYRHTDKRVVQVEVLRGRDRLAFQVPAAERSRRMEEMLDSGDTSKNLVRRLGILSVDVDDRVRRVIPLREPTGALVIARTLDGTSVDSGLIQGDVVHALNREPIQSVEALRRAIKARNPGEPVVLQIERSGQFHYLHFEMD